MIVEYVRYDVPPDRHKEFIDAYRLAAESLRESRHCLSYEVSQGVEEPDHFTVRIEWDSIDGHERGFRTAPEFAEFLGHVKPFFTEIREMKHYSVLLHSIARGGQSPAEQAPAQTPIPTMFEWIGGMSTIRPWIEHFYRRVAEEPRLAHLFRDSGPDHANHVALFLAEVLGGPKAYSAELGGHAAMIRRHAGRELTEEQRRLWMDILLTSADECGVPDDPEFRSALVSYLEWGTRLAVQNSQRGVEADESGPMPIWGWVTAHEPRDAIRES